MIRCRAERALVPTDPEEYERRRMHAQRVVDGYYGRGRYRVVGTPGQMLNVVEVEGHDWGCSSIRSDDAA